MRRSLAAAAVLVLACAPWPAQADFELYREVPVVTALRTGQLDDVKRMLVTGASSPNATDATQQPLLVVATRLGNAQAIDLLLTQGAKPDGSDQFGNTALLWAADLGYDDIAERLIAAGATVDAQNRQGLSPLMRAAREGRAKTVQVLLDAGADPLLSDYTGRDSVSWAEETRNSRVRDMIRRAAQ